MELEKGVISKYELTFLYIVVFQGTSITSAFVNSISRHDTWIVSIVAFVLSFLLLMIYIGISSKFPDKTIIEINNIAYGKWLGKVISIIYISNAWFAAISYIRYIEDFFTLFLFSETDITIIGLYLVISYIYIIRKGLECIARLAPIFVIITFGTMIFISAFTIRYVKIDNLLPLLDISIGEFSQCLNVLIAIPFGTLMVFFMITPFVSEKGSVKKYSYLGLFIGGSYFIIVILRNSLVIGELEGIITVPTYQIARLAQIPGIDIGIEAIVAIIILFDATMNALTFLYATTIGTAQLFGLRSYTYIAMPIGVISYIYSMSIYNSQIYQIYIGSNIYPIIAVLPIIIIPVITRAIIALRK